jgi:hypothetical protein
MEALVVMFILARAVGEIAAPVSCSPPVVKKMIMPPKEITIDIPRRTANVLFERSCPIELTSFAFGNEQLNITGMCVCLDRLINRPLKDAQMHKCLIKA